MPICYVYVPDVSTNISILCILYTCLNRCTHEQSGKPRLYSEKERLKAIAVYCYSAAHPNLYCFDECTCIRALKRYTPTLPSAPGQPALEDFDYIRNGTTDLLAFLNPATGQVYGQCTDNHDRHTLCQVFSSHIQMHGPSFEREIRLTLIMSIR